MIQKPRGTFDILPSDTPVWQYIEKTARDTAANFGYGEIRTPTFEATELFQRGVGDTTDVVQKEMYTFTDRENRSFTLRPEGTASVARALVENGKCSDTLPLKLYYMINCFRYEKPQAGRSREFYQFGVE
ncbi:MAG: ATP phosphoribosyltransferase regulatory subunit, partial [Clostridia bacterium]|nr:ATP phosphoribosyltransferase regulatory subunit [Clostridia bacterium]